MREQWFINNQRQIARWLAPRRLAQQYKREYWSFGRSDLLWTTCKLAESRKKICFFRLCKFPWNGKKIFMRILDCYCRIILGENRDRVWCNYIRDKIFHLIIHDIMFVSLGYICFIFWENFAKYDTDLVIKIKYPLLFFAKFSEYLVARFLIKTQLSWAIVPAYGYHRLIEIFYKWILQIYCSTRWKVIL